MSDACGCGDDKPETEEGEEEAGGFWQVTEVRAAAVSGALLLVAWIASLLHGEMNSASAISASVRFVARYCRITRSRSVSRSPQPVTFWCCP